jgi:hypothetical protein
MESIVLAAAFFVLVGGIAVGRPLVVALGAHRQAPAVLTEHRLAWEVTVNRRRDRVGWGVGTAAASLGALIGTPWVAIDLATASSASHGALNGLAALSGMLFSIPVALFLAVAVNLLTRPLLRPPTSGFTVDRDGARVVTAHRSYERSWDQVRGIVATGEGLQVLAEPGVPGLPTPLATQEQLDEVVAGFEHLQQRFAAARDAAQYAPSTARE